MPASRSKAKDTPPARVPSLGQIAWEAYLDQGRQDGTYTGESPVTVPGWDEADGKVRTRWEAAASAVAAHVIANPPPAGDDR